MGDLGFGGIGQARTSVLHPTAPHGDRASAGYPGDLQSSKASIYANGERREEASTAAAAAGDGEGNLPRRPELEGASALPTRQKRTVRKRTRQRGAGNRSR
uniref:Uncharacterized protein n=1 Tax=Leersia perrieri TaxID=77586 RepID=A0A0D9V202_9ORYZ